MLQVVRFPSRFCRSPPPSPTISDQAAGDHGFFVVLDFVSSDLRADFVQRGLKSWAKQCSFREKSLAVIGSLFQKISYSHD